MTEEEWLACTGPREMLEWLNGSASNRKLWLFACACCRRHPTLLSDDRCRASVEVGERYADRMAAPDELMEASEEAFCRRDDLAENPALEAVATAAAFVVVDPAERDFVLPPITVASAVSDTCEDLVRVAVLSASIPKGKRGARKARDQAVHDERAAQSQLLRCVVGNPSVSCPWIHRG